jgi:hypothetical protein
VGRRHRLLDGFHQGVVDQFLYSPTVGDITIILWMRYVARRYGEIPRHAHRAEGLGTNFTSCPSSWRTGPSGSGVTLVYMLPTALQLPLSKPHPVVLVDAPLFMAVTPPRNRLRPQRRTPPHEIA